MISSRLLTGIASSISSVLPLCSDSGCFFVLSAKNFAESPFGSAAGLGVQRQIFSSVVASRPLRV